MNLKEKFEVNKHVKNHNMKGQSKVSKYVKMKPTDKKLERVVGIAYKAKVDIK